MSFKMVVAISLIILAVFAGLVASNFLEGKAKQERGDLKERFQMGYDFGYKCGYDRGWLDGVDIYTQRFINEHFEDSSRDAVMLEAADVIWSKPPTPEYLLKDTTKESEE